MASRIPFPASVPGDVFTQTPRTLEEAFGPHTSQEVYEEPPAVTRRRKHRAAVLVVIFTTLAAMASCVGIVTS